MQSRMAAMGRVLGILLSWPFSLKFRPRLWGGENKSLGAGEFPGHARPRCGDDHSG